MCSFVTFALAPGNVGRCARGKTACRAGENRREAATGTAAVNACRRSGRSPLFSDHKLPPLGNSFFHSIISHERANAQGPSKGFLKRKKRTRPLKNRARHRLSKNPLGRFGGPQVRNLNRRGGRWPRPPLVSVDSSGSLCASRKCPQGTRFPPSPPNEIRIQRHVRWIRKPCAARFPYAVCRPAEPKAE